MPRFNVSNTQLIIELFENITRQIEPPILTKTLCMFVPKLIPFIVSVVFTCVNNMGVTLKICGVFSKVNEKWQSPEQIASFSSFLIFISKVFSVVDFSVVKTIDVDVMIAFFIVYEYPPMKRDVVDGLKPSPVTFTNVPPVIEPLKHKTHSLSIGGNFKKREFEN